MNLFCQPSPLLAPYSQPAPVVYVSQYVGTGGSAQVDIAWTWTGTNPYQWKIEDSTDGVTWTFDSFWDGSIFSAVYPTTWPNYVRITGVDNGGNAVTGVSNVLNLNMAPVITQGQQGFSVFNILWNGQNPAFWNFLPSSDSNPNDAFDDVTGDQRSVYDYSGYGPIWIVGVDNVGNAVTPFSNVLTI